MKKIQDLLSEIFGRAFEDCGYDSELGRVGLSNRPDLCQFQCNGAMAGAKRYKKAPIAIANEVLSAIGENPAFESAWAVNPGFLNIRVSDSYLLDYISQQDSDEHFGFRKQGEPQKVVIDYGGPNVAKPLHVGHLRSAIIGESVKRIARYAGDEVIGDIHMGDWGLQMGLIITELRERQPDLPYFKGAQESYPEEAPFTIGELEEIYPTASAKSKDKENPEAAAAYKDRAMEATKLLQEGDPGYRALWQHIINVSVADLKKNYERLKVSFDLWNGESDVQAFIPPMVADMEKGGWAYESEGALVVDVKEESDTKEIPPCMILKSDGAALYTTTDLATIKDRMGSIAPDKIIYVVDKRQELHFEQVFRCARKTGLVGDDTSLVFKGFGTVNGKDGKPFKTRDGGIMRLESLLNEVYEMMLSKLEDGGSKSESDIDDNAAGAASPADGAATEGSTDDNAGSKEETAMQIALAALKYGDLSNQASKDYIFDMDKFTSSEGDTGPYILYTIVRINSIINKYKEQGKDPENCTMKAPASGAQRDLMLAITGYIQAMEGAYEECAPHRLCAYIYELSNVFNRFYHDTRILTTEDESEKGSYIALLSLTRRVLNTCIDLLGFDAPKKM